ncbi:MAG: DUF4446 family protein [Lachnospiraceae bacterium]|nr:DUF4446 family protein [Lachnospiraceae bacterium]
MYQYIEPVLTYISQNNWIVLSALVLLVILVLVFMILTMVQIAKTRKLERRLSLFMQGDDMVSLEDVLRHVIEDNQKVKIQLKNNVDEIVKINENLLTAYRKTGIVKYNAFPGMAGKVSSSIALLNNENNGILVTTIHGSDGCYTYVKEIMNGKSINPLTREDEEALKIALEMQL